MAESQLLKIGRVNKGVNRSNRITAIDVIFDARRQKAWLLAAYAGLKGMIRHKTNRTPVRELGYEFLPSLCAQSGLRLCE